MFAINEAFGELVGKLDYIFPNLIEWVHSIHSVNSVYTCLYLPIYLPVYTWLHIFFFNLYLTLSVWPIERVMRDFVFQKKKKTREKNAEEKPFLFWKAFILLICMTCHGR